MERSDSATAPSLGEATVQELRGSLRGELVLPSDAAYDEARSVWNGMIDRRPAMIARCAGAGDVVAAIGFARSEGLNVAVRGGGHNVAGNATCDGGLVIDLSPMKAVQVDVPARTVRAQGGLTWGELDRETQAFGLATTGGLVTSTGVAGFTLGGGIGWLMREHGLACDNLISALVVTADGQTVRAREDENTELLWGLRGGGGNFGVVVEFEFRLHRVSQVMGGLVAWPVQAAGDVLRYWRDWAPGTPDQLCTMAAIIYAPPEPFVPPQVQGTPIIAIACFHTDPDGSAENDLRDLRAQQPALDVVGPMPYTAMQGMFDAGAPRGSRNYWRSGFVQELSDDAIEAIVTHADGLPAPLGQLHVHQLGGAMSRVPAGASAFGNRDAGFLMNYIGLWLDPAEDETNTAWVRAASDAMEPFGTGARYVNFLADEGEAGVRSAYESDTFARLQSLKARYDPTNFFHLNQNIKPAAPPAGNNPGGFEMATLTGKRFDNPDEVREFTEGKGRVELVDLNGHSVGLGTFEPGWRWSTNVKPIAGTDSCQVEHIGYIMRGRMGLRMDDGTEREFGPGDAFHMPPGHDAWTAGEESCVLLDFGGLTGYAKAT